MKLATRVSAFFLTALAVILIGNSVLLFTVARFYLYRQFDEQLQSSLHTLVAAIEVEVDDVKWELSDHTVTLGSENGVEDIRWIVRNEAGQVLDRSRNLQTDGDEAAFLEGTQDSNNAAQSDWRTLQLRLAAPHPKPVAERDTREHAAITVLVGRRLSDLRSTLNGLAVLLVVLSSACWLLSAVLGRWYCRQAIAPVQRMAQDVRAMEPDDVAARLPVPSSRDEMAELAVAFNELLDQLFAAYERQRRFAGDAAHQLRTPLTVLQGQVEVTMRRVRTIEEYQSTMRVMNEEVAALSRTIEALLLLAQPNTPSDLPEAGPLAISSWLNEYLHRWEKHARWADFHLDIQSDIVCETSPSLLAQLLDVLLSNAVKYSQVGSPIQVRAATLAAELVLEVEDAGIGIATEDLDSIFQPFFRARQARQSGVPGTGLGLAIAARLATSLGGSLKCESQLGVGARFRLTLPRAAREKNLVATASSRS